MTPETSIVFSVTVLCPHSLSSHSSLSLFCRWREKKEYRGRSRRGLRPSLWNLLLTSKPVIQYALTGIINDLSDRSIGLRQIIDSYGSRPLLGWGCLVQIYLSLPFSSKRDFSVGCLGGGHNITNVTLVGVCANKE